MTVNKGLSVFDMATSPEVDKLGIERDWNGAKVIVGRAGNENYQTALAEGYEKNRKIIEDRSTPATKEKGDKLAVEITLKAFCKHILLGWSGFLGKDKKPYEYNSANCIELCKKVPDLVKAVRIMSGEDEQYRTACMQADAKILKK